MRIGMTYDLRSDWLAEGYSELDTAEFDSEATIAGIEAALAALGHAPERIGHARQLVSRLAAGDRWDLVFNFAEGLYGSGREALIPALLDAYRIPYVFSDPLVLALTLDKAATKRVVRDLGLATADFVLVRSPEDIASVDLPYPLFAKPNAEGTGKGVTPASRIAAPADLECTCLELLDRFKQPVLVETYLPGREFTVGVLGTGAEARCCGVMEVMLGAKAESGVYSYNNKEHWEDRVSYRLLHDEVGRACDELALAAWRGLGCRDGGRVDLRMDAVGRPNFIEVNPLAGLHPTHSDLPMLCRMNGMDFTTLIGCIVDSALKRLNAPTVLPSAPPENFEAVRGAIRI